MSRLIDADELKKCVLKWLPQDPCGREEKEFPFETDICVSMLMEIDEQPTITPEPHWIPVTERLPEIGKYVLCAVKQPYRGRFHVCKYVDKDKYHNRPYFDWWHNGFPDVIAWMPLPEPYKEVTV